MNNLFIDLSKIVKSDGATIEFTKEYPQEIFSEMDNSISLTKPVTVVGQISNLAGTLFLKANLSFCINVACDRCLTPFVKEYEIDMEDTIAREDSLLEVDEFIPYSGNRVSLCDAIYKCIFSEISEKQLCNIDCKGLCTHCGCDLNEKQCNCKDDDIDPRLLKLKELLK